MSTLETRQRKGDGADTFLNQAKIIFTSVECLPPLSLMGTSKLCFLLFTSYLIRQVSTPSFSSTLHLAHRNCSKQLRDIWTKRIDGDDIDMSAWYYQRDLDDFKATKEDGEVVIEVADWITRLTLDAIGKSELIALVPRRYGSLTVSYVPRL